MAERFLIDASAAIKYLNNSLPVAAALFLDYELDREINLSIITKVELPAWNPPTPGDMLIVENFVKGAFVLPLDEKTGDIAISMRKATKVKLPDVLTAATAVVHNFTLVADNDKDFMKIASLNPGFKYLNPFTIT